MFDPFNGPAFDHVRLSRCVVVGPRCLLTCLYKSVPIPDLPYPIYTASMMNLVITATGFEKEEKVALQRAVERMAGVYSNAFHDGVTHLVAAVRNGLGL